MGVSANRLIIPLSRQVRATRVDSQGSREIEETVVREHIVEIRLGGQALVRLTCLPERLDDLAIGFLFTEGILQDIEKVRSVSVSESGDYVDVEADVDVGALAELRAHYTFVSGCGKAGSFTDIEALMRCERRFDLTYGIRKERVRRIMVEFQKRSELFRNTGCVHSAAVADESDVLSFSEDIGRHNAVDKAVGQTIRARATLRDKLLLTTGRLTLEIVAKAVRVSVPIIVSRAAPTDRAIELAAVSHITLAGFVRGSRMNIYSAPWRIRD